MDIFKSLLTGGKRFRERKLLEREEWRLRPERRV